MNSSMCFTLIGRDNIYSGNPFPFIGKEIRVYKFNLVYVESIKWVVELPFNVRLLYSTSFYTAANTEVKILPNLLRTRKADAEEASATQTERLQLE
ncbi:hypothetical protein Tco_1403347 [Tanacetum coccineum]